MNPAERRRARTNLPGRLAQCPAEELIKPLDRYARSRLPG